LFVCDELAGSSDGGRVSQNLRDNLPPQDHAGEAMVDEEKKCKDGRRFFSTMRVGWWQTEGAGEAGGGAGQKGLQDQKWKTSGFDKLFLQERLQVGTCSFKYLYLVIAPGTR
jgi:hypothetical protein